jgi:uncharacterized protein GlcG (DUF336 family)
MSKLTLTQANAIIEHALTKGRETNLPPLAVVVLDDSGNLKAAQREDGASMFRIDVALGKAWGAVAMSCSSRALAKRAQANPNFMIALAATAQGKFLPQQGGVLIRDRSGEILGAVGISGATGDEDEACGAFGVEKAGLMPDASA